jgi:DNA-binding protein
MPRRAGFTPLSGSETRTNQRGDLKMPILPVAPVSRLIREAGAKRVSEGARDALAEILESYGLEVAKEAVGWANHAKRKTVKAEDIREAVKRVKPPKSLIGD